MNSALIKRLRKIATLESEDYGAEPQDHSSWQAADLIERQAAQIAVMREAMQEFCTRVDNGEVRSVRTYRKFSDILSTTPDQALEQFAAKVRGQCANAIRAIKELP